MFKSAIKQIKFSDILGYSITVFGSVVQIYFINKRFDEGHHLDEINQSIKTTDAKIITMISPQKNITNTTSIEQL